MIVACQPPKLSLLIVFTIWIVVRAMRLRGTSSANCCQSCKLSARWQERLFIGRRRLRGSFILPRCYYRGYRYQRPLPPN